MRGHGENDERVHGLKLDRDNGLKFVRGHGENDERVHGLKIARDNE